MLKGAADAKPRPPVRTAAGDGDAEKPDVPGRRPHRPRDEMEERRLAGAIRPDQRMARARSDLERHGVDRAQLAVAAPDIEKLEHGRHRARPLRSRRAPPTRPPGS